MDKLLKLVVGIVVICVATFIYIFFKHTSKKESRKVRAKEAGSILKDLCTIKTFRAKVAMYAHKLADKIDNKKQA